MNCPICNVALMMAERQGVEIDYCPKCRGIWLDRGELEKIIERSQSFDEPQHYDHHHERPFDSHHSQHSYGHGFHHKKKKGFLSDLFDF